VKLLLDENLSHRLLDAIEAIFPGSAHVNDLGLQRAKDETIWTFAKENGFTILSKDADFHQRSFVYGQPPKVIWLRIGNCTTSKVLTVLESHLGDIRRFEQDEEAAFLVITKMLG
jgi:predicted nuclease of predicted toxin-antitoxin system